MKVLKIFFASVAALTLLALALFAAGHFGLLDTYRLFVVQSGSMEPTVKLGSIVVVKPLDSYTPNDIISFKDGDKVITHRIIMRHYPEGITYQPVYFTQGDVNEELDRSQVKNEDVVGKVILSLPYLGYGVDFAKRPQGFILLVIVPATIIVYEELKSLLRETLKGIKKISLTFKGFPLQGSRTIFNSEGKNDSNPLPKTSILFPIIGALLVIAGISSALLLDIEESKGNIFGAATSFGEPEASPGKIVINEVYYRVAAGHQGAGTEADWEWAELYNSGGSPVSLEGWSISDNNSCDNFPGTPTLAPSQFAIVTKQTEANFETEWPAVPDGTLYIQLTTVIGDGLADSDELLLSDGACLVGLPVDHISWGGNTDGLSPSIPTVGADGISSERSPDGVDTNTNADFVNASPPTPGI